MLCTADCCPASAAHHSVLTERVEADDGGSGEVRVSLKRTIVLHTLHTTSLQGNVSHVHSLRWCNSEVSNVMKLWSAHGAKCLFFCVSGIFRRQTKQVTDMSFSDDPQASHGFRTDDQRSGLMTVLKLVTSQTSVPLLFSLWLRRISVASIVFFKPAANVTLQIKPFIVFRIYLEYKTIKLKRGSSDRYTVRLLMQCWFYCFL